MSLVVVIGMVAVVVPIQIRDPYLQIRNKYIKIEMGVVLRHQEMSELVLVLYEKGVTTRLPFCVL